MALVPNVKVTFDKFNVDRICVQVISSSQALNNNNSYNKDTADL
jgi:hypothetical protein